MLREVSKYKTDGGQIFPVLISPQTAFLSFGSVANSPTTLDPTTDVTLAIRKDVGENGITSRKVLLIWQSEPPLGYAPGRFFYVPILTPELFAAIRKGQIGEYRGVGVIVRSKLKERIK